MRPEFVAALDALDTSNIDLCRMSRVGGLLDNRNALAGRALAWGAEAVLWLDDDQTFPVDTLHRLLAAGKDVAGCNIARKCEPSRPTAQRFDASGERERLWTDPAAAREGRLEQVSDIGLGVCLVRRKVHEAVASPYFAHAVTRTGQPVGEDYYFCERALASGFEIWVDHGLSWEVGHVDQAGAVYTSLKAWMDRPRFLLMEQNGLVPPPASDALRDYA